VHRAETSQGLARLQDALGEHRPDAGQPHQVGERGAIEIERRPRLVEWKRLTLRSARAPRARLRITAWAPARPGGLGGPCYLTVVGADLPVRRDLTVEALQ